MQALQAGLFPNRLRMEGMVRKANRVLDHAAVSDRDGVLKELFRRAKGIVLISVIESAVLLSAAAGVGIMMAKNKETGEWSPPCACGMASASWGFSLGAVIKDVIIFAMDEKSVQSFTSQLGLKLGVATSITLGTLDLNVGANVKLSETGASGTLNAQSVSLGGTVSVAFCQGAYLSASLSGGVVAPNVIVNRKFYEDATLSAKDILFRDDLDVPHNKFSSDLQAIYGKLELLSQDCSIYMDEDFATGESVPQSIVLETASTVAETKIAIIEDGENESATPQREAVMTNANGILKENDDKVGDTHTQCKEVISEAGVNVIEDDAVTTQIQTAIGKLCRTEKENMSPFLEVKDPTAYSQVVE